MPDRDHDLPELNASEAWRTIDFISDLHLAADTPRAFDAWAAYLRDSPADAVFILGDLFDAWVGDDSRHEGFEARCAAVLTKATARRHVAFMVGNRDFILGAGMLNACGMAALPDPVVLCAFGQRVLLTHGDAWCTGDVEYQRFRAQVRNPAWQAAALAQPLAQRRVVAQQMRARSEQRGMEHLGPWFDVDPTTALEAMHRARTPLMIHGHTHRPADEALAEGFSRRVLSDWELDHGTAHRAQVLRWQAGHFTRLTPAAASTPLA